MSFCSSIKESLCIINADRFLIEFWCFSSRFLAGRIPTPRQRCRPSARRAAAGAWSTRRIGRRARRAGWRSVWPWACRRAVRGTAADPTGSRSTAMDGDFYQPTITATTIRVTLTLHHRHRRIDHVSGCSRHRCRCRGPTSYSSFSVSSPSVGLRYSGPSGQPSARSPPSDPSQTETTGLWISPFVISRPTTTTTTTTR